MSVLILVVDDEEDVPASSQRYGLGGGAMRIWFLRRSRLH